MKKFLLLLLFTAITFSVFSQGAPACPQVTTGPTQTVCAGVCAPLTTTLITNNQTTSYSVSSIPYSPYPFTGTALIVGDDDLWSPSQNLLFNFCYYGNTYNKCVVGANGHICFNTSYANATDQYAVTTALPSTADMPANTINAVFRDIDPSTGGNIYYQTGGTSPCRYVVITWYNIKLYKPLTGTNCKTAYPASTFQLVLYENTNYIDVYIQGTYSCASWQNGYGIVGLLSPSGTSAVCPAGRNRTTFTATNEAWRFTPTGSPSYTFNWTGPSGSLGAALTQTVCPSSTSTYTATMVVTNCDGSSFTKTATQQVVVNPSPTVTVNSATVCPSSSAALNASGATTYVWTPATGLSASTGASVNASPSSTTVYSVTGTSSGCSSTKSTTVTVSPSPTITTTGTTVCAGSSGVLTAGGATTYSWSPSTGLSAVTGSSVTSSATATTVYTVTGTTGGCTSTKTVALTVTPLPTLTVNNATVCAGNSATFTASGATTYSWSPSTNLSPTTGSVVTSNSPSTITYTVTGTTGGCSSKKNAVLTVNPNPTVTVNSSTICPGGTATLTAAGAASYSWSTGQTTNPITVSPGSTTSYTVKGTTGSCTNTAVATVSIGSGLSISVPSETICLGGSAVLTASGATDYTWTPAATLSSSSGSSVTATPASNTTYTITGATGACSGTTTAMVSIIPNPTLTATSGTICAGQGTATLTASGVTNYSWSPSAGLSSTNTAVVQANPSTTTIYTITGSTGTCTTSVTSTVVVNNPPSVSSTTATICLGQQTATLTAAGANSYTWSPAASLSASSGTAVQASPVSNTTYTLIGQDGNGCLDTTTALVKVNPLPVVSVNSSVICQGQQTATLTAAGANSYTWSPSTGLNSSSGASVQATPGSTSSYTVTGTDANGCYNNAVSTVTVNPLPSVASTSVSVCTGQPGTISASGASTYTWSTGDNTVSITESPASTTHYTVTGTDANGCYASAVGEIAINSKPVLSVNDATICVGNSATLTASGASSFNWNPTSGLSAGNTATVSASPLSTTIYTVTGSNGLCSDTITAVVTVNQLPVISASSSTICSGQNVNVSAAGASSYTWSPAATLSASTGNPVTATPSATQFYSVQGTDGNGCTGNTTFTIVVNPTPTITVNSASICFGQQSATLTAGGASSYSWSPATGLNTTTGSSVVSNPSSIGNYTYTVTGMDINGCSSSTVSIVNAVANPTVTVNTATICAGQQTALLTANSNTSNFNWMPSTGLSPTTGSAVNANPPSTTAYTVLVSAGSCTAQATTTVTVNNPPVLTTISSTICAGEQTGTLTVSGASTYTWMGGNVSPINGSSVSDSPVATTVYTVSGTDVNTCTATATATITVNPLPTISVTSSTICVGQQTATLTASGANTYSWTPGVTPVNAATVTASPSPAGTYTYLVTGTDSKGCYSSATASITSINNPTLSVSSGAICAGQTIFTLTANSDAQSFSWSPAATLGTPNTFSTTANPSSTQQYTVVGTSGSCTVSGVATVTVNTPPTLTVTNSTICIGQQTGTLTVSGAGTGGSYSWSAGVSPATGGTVTASPAITTTYSVNASDANTCTATATAIITVNSLPNVVSTSTAVCIGQSGQLTANGANTYTWSTSTTGSSMSDSPSQTTSYTVVGTDANSCYNSAIGTITVNPLPQINAAVNPAAICTGATATLSASGAGAGGTYAWTGTALVGSAANAQVFAQPVNTGSLPVIYTYTVTGTDNTSTHCSNTNTVAVTVNELPKVTVTPPNSSGCTPLNVAFTATSTPSASTYSWNFGNGEPLITTGSNVTSSNYTATGNYTIKVTVADVNGCVNSGTAHVTAFALPTADFDYGVKPVSVLAPEVQFINQSTPGLPNYQWNFGDPYGHDTSSAYNPVHYYTDAGTYTVSLTVSSSYSCTATITKTVIINEDYAFYVPNTFTPNGDNENETFRAYGEGVKDFKMYIYDRWGNLLYYTEDMEKGWEGKYQGHGDNILQQDTYVWKIELKTFQKQRKSYNGTVTLLK